VGTEGTGKPFGLSPMRTFSKVPEEGSLQFMELKVCFDRQNVGKHHCLSRAAHHLRFFFNVP
jgi:hypothetical protein